MYGLIAKLKSHPDKRDALCSILLENASKMPGCFSYVVSQDSADSDAMEFYSEDKSMALEMKVTCERCAKLLEFNSVAFICSYECTFCESCGVQMNRCCPNCKGELVARPKRSTK